MKKIVFVLFLLGSIFTIICGYRFFHVNRNIRWIARGKVDGVTGRYTPIVITSVNTISVYGNYDGTEGYEGLYMRTGDWLNVNDASVVLPNSAVTDQADMPFIRTAAVVKGTSGKYYAVIHVGDSYPSATGYTPGWATSDDGKQWKYQGKFVLDKEPMPYIYSSAANLIVQEDKLSILDEINPTNNRYLVWEDASTMVPSKKLIMLYSADGLNWKIYKNTRGEVVDVWPRELIEDSPMFPSAARTPYGYHIIASDTYPANYHRHLFSCDGLTWRVLDENAETYVQNTNNPKGTNLVYEESTNILHALTSGYHFELKGDSITCPVILYFRNLQKLQVFQLYL